LNDLEAILGTAEFFNDRVAFPRWQLLQSLSGSPNLSNVNNAWPENGVTLIGWTDEGQLEVTTSAGEVERIGTTLYFLEVSME
jgi:hypothetical protein